MSAWSARLPDDNAGRLPDGEHCLVTIDGVERPVRLHDYATLYALPGLYAYVLHELLECRSPELVAGLLDRAITAAGERLNELTVLDLGAGNGLAGAALARRGARRIVGVDIVPEAKVAAAREQPGVYADYFVADLTRLDAATKAALRSARPDCMLCLSAIGLGHLPPQAFGAAFDLLAPGAWVAFNIKEDFLERDAEGFAGLIARMLEQGLLEQHARERYQHRRHVDGRALINVAIVGRKRGQLGREPGQGPARGAGRPRPAGRRGGVERRVGPREAKRKAES
jgi:SAM-dependent methyltransferase